MEKKVYDWIIIASVIVIFLLMMFILYKIIIDKGDCVINPLNYATVEAQKSSGNENIACACFDIRNIPKGVDAGINVSEIKIK